VPAGNQLELVMADLMREQRLQIMLTEQELRAIDDWRFERRMPTRAAAVRELLQRGLASEGFGAARAGKKSEDFGVISAKGAASGARAADN
jgi:hypothetical protein